MSIVVSAIFGYILALGVTFAIQNLTDTTGAGTFAVKEIFLQSLGDYDGEGDAVHHRRGTALLRHVVDHLGLADDATRSHATGRRRDIGCWRQLNRERVPYLAAAAVVVLAFLCAFPAYFGTNGAVAYAAVTSIATIGLYIAYAMPIYLRLRLGDSWEPGEWNLGKHYKWIGVDRVPLGRVHLDPLHGTAAARPGSRGTAGSRGSRSTTPRSPCCGTLLLVGIWWLVSARKWFKGPIVQGTPEELARIEAQYEHPGAAASSA